jgi:3-hydroxymyristoyl/3-hydroxydecanoyl-(acyl carrier protein) dehydratase
VLLLDEIMYALCCAGERWRVETVKFHHTVLPGETLQLQVQRHEDGGYIFEARSDGQRVVSGLLLPQAAAAAPGSP